jgi:hypothetical protein
MGQVENVLFSGPLNFSYQETIFQPNFFLSLLSLKSYNEVYYLIKSSPPPRYPPSSAPICKYFLGSPAAVLRTRSAAGVPPGIVISQWQRWARLNFSESFR